MATYRIKRFTFADKRAFRELYRATNGLSTGANIGVNMGARDTVRLSNLANQWTDALKTGNTSGINFGEAKTMLNNMGLPNTANGVEHLANKYVRFRNDPELGKRYYRMMNYKQRNKEQWYDSLLLQSDSKPINWLKSKLGMDIPKVGTFKGKIRFNPKVKLNKFANRLMKMSTGAERELDASPLATGKELEITRLVRLDLLDKGFMLNGADNFPLSSASTFSRLKMIKESPSSLDEFRKGLSTFKDRRDFLTEINNVVPGGINRNIRKDVLSNKNVLGIINSNPSSLPGIVLHEYGHNAYSLQFPLYYEYERKNPLTSRASTMLTLADENGASAKGMSLLKKMTNDLSILNNLLGLLLLAHNTYFTGGLPELVKEVLPVKLPKVKLAKPQINHK